jgi:hypothetical protein
MGRTGQFTGKICELKQLEWVFAGKKSHTERNAETGGDTLDSPKY